MPWQAEKKYYDMYPIDEVSDAKNPHAPVDMPDLAFYVTANQKSPQEPVDSTVSRQSRRAYYATIAEMDAQVVD